MVGSCLSLRATVGSQRSELRESVSRHLIGHVTDPAAAVRVIGVVSWIVMPTYHHGT
jgi:hypothetical protein